MKKFSGISKKMGERLFSSASENKPIAVVFGGTGFVGHNVAKALSPHCSEVRLASRNPSRLEKSKDPILSLPNVKLVEADALNQLSVDKAVNGAQVVVNLIGILHETSRLTFHDAHVKSTSNISKAAKEAGATTAIQVSAIGASKTSQAEYARTKAMGEESFRNVFADGTILRPSVIFGPGDGFFNLFAKMARFAPALPLVGYGVTKFQPVYVGDVAEAVKRSAFPSEGAKIDPRGKTFELGGPDVSTFRQFFEVLFKHTKQPRPLIPLPFWLMNVPAQVFQYLPNPPITPDQIKNLKTDNIVSQGALTLADLGITPRPMDEILPTYLGKKK